MNTKLFLKPKTEAQPRKAGRERVEEIILYSLFMTNTNNEQ